MPTNSAPALKTVSFPRGTGQWDGEYTAINKGVNFFIEATAGTTYLIKVSGAAKGTTIYLEEKEFSAGESRTNPIVMEDDEYTFTKDGAADLWLQYNVTEVTHSIILLAEWNTVLVVVGAVFHLASYVDEFL